MSEHTATPERTDFYDPLWRVTSEGYLARAQGGYIALRSPFRADAFEGENRSDHTDVELDANAAFIVRAVNAHQPLVDALLIARAALRSWNGLNIPILEEPICWRAYETSPEIKAIDAALKLAEA